MNNILYSELLFAVNKFNSGKCNYIPSNKAAGYYYKYCGYFKVAMYTDKFYYDTYDGNILLLNLKNERWSVISIDFQFFCIDNLNSLC